MSYGYVSSADEVIKYTRAQDFRPLRAEAKLHISDVCSICQTIAESRINPVLSSLGINLPLTEEGSPNAWKILAYLNAIGAACTVDRIVFTEVGVSAKDSVPWTCTEFENQLKALAEGKIDLIDFGLSPSDEDIGEFFYSEDMYFNGLSDVF